MAPERASHYLARILCRNVTDARDGTPLYEESLVCSLGDGIDCQVRGNATQGYVADPCAAEVSTAMPYGRVEWSGPETGSAFGDVTGAVTIPYAGTAPLTVTARLGGRYFTVNDSGGTTVSTLSISLLPGAVQTFTHNLANATEALRAQVNAYLHANIARDLVLDYNPEYPVIVSQEGASAFPINVNIAQTCNAFYNGTSINFYRAGGGCNNTGFGTVVHHEYGHHLVNVAGSGQGEYGEGFSDVVGVLVTDNPRLADGFSTCGAGIRRADNACQYQPTGCSSCGSAIHTCGQVISGCVWDTRVLLGQTEPAEALNIIRTLALDSVLLHTGTSITPDITVDFMMLDDDNSTIADGTPHYDEIQAGFSAHAMPGPPLSPIVVDLPSGVPQLTRPDGTTLTLARVRSISSQVQPGTVKLRWRIPPATDFAEATMADAGTELYQANLPAAPCGSTVEWYVQAQSVSGITVTSPANAPSDVHRSLSAFSRTVAFYDNFEGNLGWTAGAAGDNATSGIWVRVDPNGTSAQPEDDASNPGTVCWVTGQGSPGAGVGSADVDGGTTTLVSPALNASGPGLSYLRYSRWYSNNMGSAANSDSMPIEVSNDNGATWTQLEVVTENANAWVSKTFAINPIFPAPSAQFRIRLQARDLGAGSIVEAGLDEVELFHLTCAPSLPGDVNGDGAVNGQDLSALLSAWGTAGADLNGDAQTNGLDLAILLSSWTG